MQPTNNAGFLQFLPDLLSPFRCNSLRQQSHASSCRYENTLTTLNLVHRKPTILRSMPRFAFALLSAMMDMYSFYAAQLFIQWRLLQIIQFSGLRTRPMQWGSFSNIYRWLSPPNSTTVIHTQPLNQWLAPPDPQMRSVRTLFNVCHPGSAPVV